jgi:hypothetical protein
VHPGFFFDFPHEAYVIVSLLPEPRIFDQGTTHLLARATIDQRDDATPTSTTE